MTESNGKATPVRYHSLAIVLHWLIAAAILFMLISGLIMVNADLSKADQYNLYQIHKGAGVLLLFSVILRILVRVMTRQPALPNALTKTEKRLAKSGHLGLYGVLLLMPLSGWLMVSASPFGLPTVVFDMFQWPHIPGVARNKEIESLARNIHWYTAVIFISFIVIHVGAVIKHRIKQNVLLLPRMWWSKRNVE